MSDGRPDRIDERARSDHSDRDRRERIRRLRVRILNSGIADVQVRSMLYAILDLLADEL